MNTILIAEDEALFAKMLRKVFNESGFETCLAEDGKQAVHLYNTRNPNIILMDIDMPHRNGWQVLEIIRKEDKTIPVVLMSGKRISEADSLRSYKLGAVSFFRKPFFPKEIVAHIQSLIKMKYDFDETLAMGGFSLNLANNRLKINNEDHYLTDREAKILYLLAKNEDKIVGYQEFITQIWHCEKAPNYEQMIRNIIAKLRKCLIKAERINIEYIYGKGYILKIISK
jgi:DNA-binding response OmpR family regulator